MSDNIIFEASVFAFKQVCTFDEFKKEIKKENKNHKNFRDLRKNRRNMWQD